MDQPDILNFAPTFETDLFFDLSPDLLIIAGYDGYFKKINPAVSKTLGYTDEELFAKPIREFIYEEDKYITAQNRITLLNDNPLLNFDNRYVTNSGEIVWLSWTSIPVKNQEMVYAIAKNITHKKKLEEQRNFLLASLTRVNKELKQFSYTTAHDLRAPVNNLLSIFELLETSKISITDTKPFIERLKTGTTSLKETLNNFIDSLIAADNQELKIEKLNIGRVLTEVRITIENLILTSNTSFSIDLSGFSEINFNQHYLESIFLNLITNSIKYCIPGVATIISISTKLVGGQKQLTFEDNGCGLEIEEVRNRIFGLNQKFHQTDDSKGIGLYLVYNHIINLGGKIDIQSKINKGTKFIITFKN